MLLFIPLFGSFEIVKKSDSLVDLYGIYPHKNAKRQNCFEILLAILAIQASLS